MLEYWSIVFRNQHSITPILLHSIDSKVYYLIAPTFFSSSIFSPFNPKISPNT